MVESIKPFPPDAAPALDKALRAAHAAPNTELPISAPPQGDGFALAPQASAFPLGGIPRGRGSFMESSAGDTKFAWARSGYANFGGHGWGWQNASQTLLMGGRTSKDSALAAIVSNEMLTSNSSLFTLVLNLTTQCIGSGLQLSYKPDARRLGISPEQARQLSHDVETAFAAWAGSPSECDITGRHDLHSLASSAFIGWLLQGEILAVLDWKKFSDCKSFTKVNLLDPMQLDRTISRMHEGLNVLTGVAFSPNEGRLKGYLLRSVPMGSWHTAPLAKFVPHKTSFGRTKVIHIFQNEDARQVRGRSPLVGTLTPGLEQSTLAELLMARSLIEASYTMSVESASSPKEALDGLVVNERLGHTQQFEEWAGQRDEFYSQAKIHAAPGVVNFLAPGDKLHMHAMQSPGAHYDSFDKSLLRRAAKTAGASYEDLTGDFSNTSFSASRMATYLPHHINLRRRREIAGRFYQEVFVAWLEEAFNMGRIELPKEAPNFYEARDAYTRTKWLGLGRVSPDEKKSAEAIALQLELGTTTYTDALGEMGIDFESQIEVLQEERATLEKLGLSHPFFAKEIAATNDKAPSTTAPKPVPGSTEKAEVPRRGRGRPPKAQRVDNLEDEA